MSGEICCAHSAACTLALTFDDGPDPRWTPQILAILQRHGAVATFCMVSRNVAGQEALVRQIVDAEDPAKPLSDSQISQMLEEQGIHVARRTVAKYREALKIAPTQMRKAM